MDRILLAFVTAFLYSSPSFAAGDNRIYDEFQPTLVSYQKIGFDKAMPLARVPGHNRPADESVTIEEKSMHDWLDHSSSSLGASVGAGVAPFFDAYGVFRTSSNQKKPTYIALGYFWDELILDDADSSDYWNDSGISFGFGVNDSSFSFEYMMSIDVDDDEVSTIGMGFAAEF